MLEIFTFFPVAYPSIYPGMRWCGPNTGGAKKRRTAGTAHAGAVGLDSNLDPEAWGNPESGLFLRESAKVGKPIHVGMGLKRSRSGRASPSWTEVVRAETNVDDAFAAFTSEMQEHLADKEFEGLPLGLQYLVDHLSKRILEKMFFEYNAVDEATVNAIEKEKKNPADAVRRIKRATKKLRLWGRETQPENEWIQSEMVPDHLKDLIRPKNLGLWKKPCEELGHPDKDLWKDVAQGFNVIGSLPKTGVWEPLDMPEEISEEDIQCYLDNAEKLKLTKPDWMPDDILESVSTDFRKGLVDGRLIKKSISELRAPPSKCFGVRQANKIRTIVDQRLLNKVTGYREKMRLMGNSRIIDIIGAFAAPLGCERQGLRSPGTQTRKQCWKKTDQLIREAKQEKVQGTLKRVGSGLPWKAVEEAAKLVGAAHKQHGSKLGVIPHIRCEDWKAAYHQFGARQLWANSLIFWDTVEEEWQGAESVVLNMGNKLSVPNFCRISEFVSSICMRMAGVITSIYIDDGAIIHSPPVVEAAGNTTNSEEATAARREARAAGCDEVSSSSHHNRS